MLDTILDQVAVYMEKTASLQRKVRGALVYPTVVLSFAILITIFLMVKVVPVFKQIFDDLGGDLPLMTKVTVFCSNLLLHKGLYIFGRARAGHFFRSVLGKDAQGSCGY